MSATNSVRYPDTTSRATMTKRAWWLVWLNILVPGSAQLLAGNRKLGRFGVGATFILWGIALIGALLYWLARPTLVTIVTNVYALWIIQAVFAFYAALWIVLTVDAVRQLRLVTTAPGARPLIAGLATIALVIGAGGAGWGVYAAGITRSTVDHVFSGGEIADPIDGRYNILLLGGDAGPDRFGLRPDSISVVSIEAATGKVTMFGIPRNLQHTPFPEGSPMLGPFPDGYDCGNECLISYLYTYGEEHPELYPDAVARGSEPGIEAMRDAAAGVLGMQLQYYVLIDMQGFSDLINALGGVTIESTGRYPLDGEVDGDGQPFNVTAWIEPGVQKMDGFTALWYARIRHGSSDYDRMARQRQVQEAILQQFDPANVLTKFQAVAEAGAQVVKTDIPQGMLGRFIELASKARGLPIDKLELVPPLIHVIEPDFEYIHELVDEALVTPTPPPAP